jgi:hypothetical protein
VAAVGANRLAAEGSRAIGAAALHVLWVALGEWKYSGQCRKAVAV